VIKSNDEGYFSFIDSNIHDNYAFENSFGEVFSSHISSTISNSSIERNILKEKDEIINQILTQGKLYI